MHHKARFTLVLNRVNYQNSQTIKTIPQLSETTTRFLEWYRCMLHGIQSLLYGKLEISGRRRIIRSNLQNINSLSLFLSFGRKNAIRDLRGGPDSRFLYRAYFMEKSDPHWLWKTWKILEMASGKRKGSPRVGKCVTIEVWK